MTGTADWGPVLFGVLTPLLCGGAVLAVRVATKQGRLDQEVREIKGDISDLKGDVRYLTRRTTGSPSPSERRDME